MIYLDNHATTPCDPRVIEVMIPFFSRHYGNASSDHPFGQIAADAVYHSKCQIAELIHCNPQEIIFTSGATESNNLSILGLTGSAATSSKRKTLVTTPIEHKSVIEPIRQLTNKGWLLDYLPVDSIGQVDLQEAKKKITHDVLLISVQLANSEIGTIQEINTLTQLAHQKGVAVHCDASQAIGKMNVDVEDLNVDLLSFSGHKINGPKGIGILWIKNGFEKALDPLMYGGDQMLGLRPGTLPIPLIVGVGKACEILITIFEHEYKHLQELRDTFENILLKEIPSLLINGARHKRLVNNSSLTFPSVDAEALLLNLDGVIASTGSACESGSIEPSRVLTSIGIPAELAYQTIRFGFGRFNTMSEIETAANMIIKAYQKLVTIQNSFMSTEG